MHLFLHGQASGVIHLVVVLKYHCNSICQQGDQFFVLAVFSQCQIGGFCHGCNGADKRVLSLLRSYILSFCGFQSWLQIEGFTFVVCKSLTFSGRGYLSSLALSFSSPIFSDKRLLKIAAKPAQRGGEVFSLTLSPV